MSFRDRFAQRTVEENVKEEEVIPNKGEAEYLETFVRSPFFSVTNLGGEAPCLELCFADGNSTALPYSYFIKFNYNPSEGIEILTSTEKVTITGRNMKLMFRFLVAYRVSAVVANIGNDLTPPKELFVRNIKVEEL